MKDKFTKIAMAILISLGVAQLIVFWILVISASLITVLNFFGLIK